MAEAIGAAAALVSVVGFSAQVFDGCVKGFVLLSSARNLDRDAETLVSKLDWEQYRLEQWAEGVGLHDPASRVDALVDWDLAAKTLQQLDKLCNDTASLKSKYGLILEEEPADMKVQKPANKPSKEASRFKRLFAQSESRLDIAGRVIQAKNSPGRRLWWASVDKDNFNCLIADISFFVQRLHDSLNASVQTEMRNSIKEFLREATYRYESVPDLDYLRELAADLRKGRSSNSQDADEIEEQIDLRFRNLLFSSISHGKEDEVRNLLDKGMDADMENHCGWSTLICAADAKQVAISELLLKRGGDPCHETIGGRRPLHFAAENGTLEIVNLLLECPSIDLNYQDHHGETAFFKAASHGHDSVVEEFLKLDCIDINAATTDGFTPLLQANFGNYKRIVQLLLARPELDVNRAENLYHQTPLWMAATENTDILIEHLKRKDIDINARGRFGETPLCRCARTSYNESMQVLLKANADVNLIDEDSCSPLMSAAKASNEHGVELLLKQSGIEWDKQTPKGHDALFLASEAGHTKCVRSLLTKIKSVDNKDRLGRTALAAAASNGHKIPVKMLLKAKADINTQDGKGNTPLALAAEGNHESVVRLLLESGADREVADEDEETPFEKARDKHLDSILQVFKETLTI
ncbi:uncharacterized protein KY384_005377 [Bacidia gigantensis]|uniref:uncharacterized protein n=1 Tax=Bacidia gigantensis TaxID=2732470 RepID=UPI001D046787|nr:uncharacterized protein KY384_005377 [Bacidia gigantensis]KAG8529896.1 hypothetical protein KY384_005377 [Bacidia gigantensis]